MHALHDAPVATLRSAFDDSLPDTIPPTRFQPLFEVAHPLEDDDAVPTLPGRSPSFAPGSVTLQGPGFRLSPPCLWEEAPATVRDPAPWF